MSTNGGSSWSGYTQVTYGGVACSADGHTIILDAVSSVLVSPDTGNSWYQVNPPIDDAGVMSAADGKTLAILYNGYIYLSLPPPSQSSALSAAMNTSNGLPMFQLTGQPGYTYIIESSTNLVNWANIAVLVNTNGMVYFTDPASTNYTQRFYRAVAPY